VVPAEVRASNDLDTVIQGSAKSGVQGGLSRSVDGMSFNERDQVATNQFQVREGRALLSRHGNYA
jgi:hypothetical protein